MRQIIFVILILSCSLLNAQGLFENSLTKQTDKKAKLNFSGYVRGSAYGGGEVYDYTSIFGEFSIQGKLSYNRAFLFTELRFRSGLQFNRPSHVVELREAYAGYNGEKFDLLLGNQIITWGRTGGYNPTNNITPNDYFFFTAEPDDQKLSNFLLRIKYRINSKIDLDIIAIPVYKPSIYRFSLFELGENVSFTLPTLPDKTFENGSFAARINFELSKVGFSFSYFRGYDPYYGFNVTDIDWSTGIPLITNSATPYLKNTIGADIALPVGSVILRGEIANNILAGYDDEMFAPKSDLYYVVGAEKSFGGFNTILQYIGRYTFDFTPLKEPIPENPSDPASQIKYFNDLIYYESTLFNRKIFYQQKEFNHAFSLMISKYFVHEILYAELTAVYNITSEEIMLRPKISWKISDALTSSVGCSYMHGPDASLFSYAGPVMNGVFLELRVSF